MDFAAPRQMQAYRQAFLRHDEVRFPVKVCTINDSKNTNREQQVKLTGNLKTFANMCGFRPGKLMRFKLVSTFNAIPVFHVC